MKKREGAVWGDDGAWVFVRQIVGATVLDHGYWEVIPVEAETPSASSFADAVGAWRATRPREAHFAVEALVFARSVYDRIGIPQGERFWRQDENSGEYLGHSTQSLGDIQEEDLWDRFGLTEGGPAWAAGQVIRLANGVLRIRPLVEQGGFDPTNDGTDRNLPELVQSLALHSYWLGCAVFRLELLTKDLGLKGATAVEILESAEAISRKNQSSGVARGRRQAQADAPMRAEALAIAKRIREKSSHSTQEAIAEAIEDELGGRFSIPEHEAICGWIRKWRKDKELPPRLSRNLKQRR